MIELVTQERVSFAGEEIVLIGDPRRCAGLVRVHNPHDVAVKLKRIRLRTDDRAIANRCDGQIAEIDVSAPLCPGETQLLRVKLRLPAGTPPGRYQAWLEGEGKQARPVTIEVLERRKTRLSPGAITHACRPGDTFSVRVTASNLGNVPVEVPSRAVVELHPGDRGWLHHFHAAARSHGDRGYQSFLDGFVRRLGQAEPPLGRARVRAGQGLLEPQQGRVIEVEISLPKKLRARRSYLARVRLAGASLRMTLHVDAANKTISAVG